MLTCSVNRQRVLWSPKGQQFWTFSMCYIASPWFEPELFIIEIILVWSRMWHILANKLILQYSERKTDSNYILFYVQESEFQFFDRLIVINRLFMWNLICRSHTENSVCMLQLHSFGCYNWFAIQLHSVLNSQFHVLNPDRNILHGSSIWSSLWETLENTKSWISHTVKVYAIV